MIKTDQKTYYAPHGGHPGQNELLTGRAVFTEAYAVIPKGVMQDIVTSPLPFWDKTRAWIIARPLSGFAETFSQYIVEVLPGGGSDRPEPDAPPGINRSVMARPGCAVLPLPAACPDGTRISPSRRSTRKSSPRSSGTLCVMAAAV